MKSKTRIVDCDTHELRIHKSKVTITDNLGTRRVPNGVAIEATGDDEQHGDAVILLSQEQAHELVEQLMEVLGYHKTVEFSKN